MKLSATVEDRDVRHLLWLQDEVGDDLRDLVVLTTGPEAYRRADGVAVVPLALLGPDSPGMVTACRNVLRGDAAETR